MTTKTQPLPTDALAPCPFCGTGDTHIHVNKGTWTGSGYGEPVSVEVRHWCPAEPGQPSRMLAVAGRDQPSAIALWNRRTPAPVGVEPAFYTVFAKFEGAPIPLAQYSASSETGVLERVMDAARKEGYTGHPQDRMTELGWVVGPVYAAPQSLAMERVPLEEWHVRGRLAASLTCWHRLTDNEAAELVAFVTGVDAHGVKQGGQHGDE